MTDEQTDKDWASRLTAHLAQFTEVIREHSVKPLTGVLRVVAGSLIMGLVGLVVIIVLVLGLVRLLDNDVFSGRAWATDTVIGGMFACAGMFFVRQGSRTRNGHG